MTEREQVQKNLELAELFSQEMLANAELARRIPQGANVFFIPSDDPELASANRKLARKARRQGKRVVLISIRLIPRTTYVPVFGIDR